MADRKALFEACQEVEDAATVALRRWCMTIRSPIQNPVELDEAQVRAWVDDCNALAHELNDKLVDVHRIMSHTLSALENL